MPLMMLHPETGDVQMMGKGEGEIAIDLFEQGYRGLTQRTNDKLQDASWDRQNRAARDEFRKVECHLPTDTGAHPMSGRVGSY